MIKFTHHHQKRNQLFRSVFGFSLVFFCLLLLGAVLLQPTSGLMSVALRPIWWAGEGLSLGSQSIIDFFHNHNRLAIENRQLKEENVKFRSIILAKNQVEEDNLYFRQLLGRVNEQKKPVVGAVIFLPNFVPYQTLLIDLGRNNINKSLKIGDLAVADSRVLVGRVVEIGNWYSKVRLLSAEKNLTVAIGDKNVPGLAEGMGVGNYGIILPRDTIVEVGDRVVAPLFDNLLIGTVRHIDKRPSQPNQTVLVKTTVNLWQLKWLELYGAKT